MNPLVHTVMVNESDGPSVDGGVHDRDRGNENQAFMSGGIASHAVSKIDQHGEDEHADYGTGILRLGIDAWKRSNFAIHRIRGGKYAEDHHEAREPEAR